MPKRRGTKNEMILRILLDNHDKEDKKRSKKKNEKTKKRRRKWIREKMEEGEREECNGMIINIIRIME